MAAAACQAAHVEENDHAGLLVSAAHDFFLLFQFAGHKGQLRLCLSTRVRCCRVLGPRHSMWA